MKLSGSAVLTPEGFRPGTVTVENGIIQAVETDRAPENSESYDAGNGYILPGFLDIHIHGYAGADMSDGSVEGIGRMAKALAREGVTGFLGTTMALPESSLMQVAASTVRPLSPTARSFLACIWKDRFSPRPNGGPRLRKRSSTRMKGSLPGCGGHSMEM